MAMALVACSESHEDDDAPAELDTPVEGCGGDCASLGMVCDPASETCVECLDDSGCTAPRRCTGSHVCVSSCACVSDADCDDGVFCNGAETCASDCEESCVAGTAVSCEAGERCDERMDACEAPPECELPRVWYRDSDEDGYGDPADARRACMAPTGYVARFGDCDDVDVLQSPGAGEACDGTIDDDCDGAVDEGCTCTFGSRPCGRMPGCAGTQMCASGMWQGCSVLAASIELCGGGDEDCDGVTDEASTAFYCGEGASCEDRECTPARVRSLGVGLQSAYAVLDDGRLLTWGLGGATPVLVERALPTRDVRGGFDSGGAYLGVGTCALLEGGRLGCGSGTGVGIRSEARDVIAVDASLDVACFVEREGEVRCWGSHVNLALGPGYTMSQYTAVPITGVDDGADVAITTGAVCALRGAGNVRCWGSGAFGLLGNGTTDSSPLPVTVSLVNDGTRLVASESHICVERASDFWCWGNNAYGQLADGTMVPARSSPVPMTALPAGARMPRTMAEASTCVITAEGGVICMGEGSVGQLGNGRMESSREPVVVTGLTDVVELAGGGSEWCALTASNEVYCWGHAGVGSLGDGTTLTSATPVRVAMLP
jgi:alpha-tubulin suppressor-like RCC1 family protein